METLKNQKDILKLTDLYLASIHFRICTLSTPLTDVRTNVKSFHKIDLKFVRVFIAAAIETKIFKRSLSLILTNKKKLLSNDQVTQVEIRG